MVAGASHAWRREPGAADACAEGAATRLRAGDPIARRIGPGQRHAYRVELAEGTFARAEVGQQALDVVVELLGADGRLLAAIDNPYETRRPEPVPLLNATGGATCFVVRPWGEAGPEASYRVRIEVGPRPVTAADRALFEGLVELGSGEQAAGSRSFAAALPHLARAADRLRAAGEPLLEAEARQALGESLLQAGGDAAGDAGSNAQALGELSAALALYRGPAGREPTVEAGLLNYLGLAQQRLGLLRAARESHQEALLLAAQSSQRTAERIARANLAAVLARLGALQEGLDLGRRWLVETREQELADEELAALGFLASSRINLGSYAAAKRDAEDLLARARKAGDVRFQAMAWEYLGSLDRRRSAWGEAGRAFAHGLSLLAALPVGTADAERARLLSGLAITLSNQGEHAAALARIREAAGIYTRLGRRLDLSLTRFNEGTVLAAAGRPAEGLARCDEALAAFEELGHRSGQASALLCRARALASLGQPDEALPAAERSIAVVESLSDELEDPELRLHFRESKGEYYATYIDLLMRQGAPSIERGRVARALEASEQTHARLLLEDLWALRDGLRRKVDPALQERLASLRARLWEAGGPAASPAARGGPEPRPGCTAWRAEYEQVEEEIRRRSAAYAALTRPRVLKAIEIQRQLLDPETALLVYSLGPERSYLWYVGSSSLESFRLADGPALSSAAVRAATLVARGSDPTLADQAEVALADLSRALLGPLAGRLEARRLVVVPEGALQYVPFGALPHPDHLDRAAGSPVVLLDRHEVVTLPSASVLAVLRQTRARRPRPNLLLALVGDPVLRREDSRLPPGALRPRRDHRPPDAAESAIAAALAPEGLSELPYARAEIEALRRKVAPGLAVELSGLAAHRERLLAGALRGARIVHFATHASVDAAEPGASRIVLSRFDAEGRPRDGSLSLLDVYSLELDADLVVLSACSTALGRETAGEGLIGFTRGFMYAGVSSVVVSLWDVDDEATSVLMERFYSLLLEEGLPPGAALREAQLSLRREPRWQRPYHWAAFSLHGDWR